MAEDEFELIAETEETVGEMDGARIEPAEKKGYRNIRKAGVFFQAGRKTQSGEVIYLLDDEYVALSDVAKDWLEPV